MRTADECYAICKHGYLDGLYPMWSAPVKSEVYAIFHGEIYYRNAKKFAGPSRLWVFNDMADYVLSLYPKESPMTLDDAVTKILADIPLTSAGSTHIVVWGRLCDGDVVRTVADAIIGREETNFYTNTHTVVGKPTNESVEQAAIVLRVSGPLNKIEINVQKNRYGNTFNLHADAIGKGTTMPTEGFPYKHLSPDSAGYAECFKIMREALKDDVIYDWCYSPHMPDGHAGIDVYIIPTHYESFRDPDKTKGDIGLLREAADYVLELKYEAWLKQQMPDPKTMTADQMNAEILSSGYKLMETTHANHTTPTFGLFRASHGPTGYSLQENETMPQFLRKCIEYIRSHKK